MRQILCRAVLAILAMVAIDPITGWVAIRAAIAQTPISLVVIVSERVPVTRLDAQTLSSIYRGNTRTWPDGAPILPLNLTAGSPARTEFDRVVLLMTPDEIAKYWIDRRVRGEGSPPRQLPNPDLVVRLVQAMAGSVAYVPESNKLTDKVRVVARIREGRVWAP